MKIAYCTNSIKYCGGIESVTVAKANALAEVEGYTVYLIVTDNKEDKGYFSLSPKVKVIYLEIHHPDDGWKSKFHLVKSLALRAWEYRKKLKTVIKEIQPDIIISTGTSEKYLINSIKGNAKTIRETHFESNYRYRLSNIHTFLDRYLATLGKYLDYYYSISHYDLIVLLTEEDRNTNWKNITNAISMPNPVTFSSAAQSDKNSKEIISAGRLTYSKNFDALIRSCKEVFAKYPDWHLTIWGEGSERKMLTQLISKLNLESNISLPGATKDIGSKMLNSSIFALSSQSEGFGLVIVEAMECGLPVVSYSCPAGPKDIITDEVNGFLITPGDEKTFAERICQLIEDKDLRVQMGNAAKLRAKDFHIDRITALWCEIFENLVTGNKTK